MSIDFWPLLFWTNVALILWVYAGYPTLLQVMARGKKIRPIARDHCEPGVTLVISAYNEEGVIGAKLENSLALDYPSELLEILVVSDYSDDQTDTIVQNFGDPRIRLLRLPARSGKTAGLNLANENAVGEIIVFSDSNAMYRPDAIRCLVRNFADPTVGAVTGESRYADDLADPSTESESAYWHYELRIKAFESAIGSVVGGDGAIYAIRRQLYKPMDPSDLSDFVNPMQIVARGYRNVYEPGAISYEGGADGFGAEFRRKVRIVNRAWHAMLKMRHLLNPFQHGFFAVQFWSHKLLRWLVPVFLILLILSNLVIVGRTDIYLLALICQAIIYGAAIVGMLFWLADRPSPKLVQIPFYFCLVNVASLVGVCEAMAGKKYTTWLSSRPVQPASSDNPSSME